MTAARAHRVPALVDACHDPDVLADRAATEELPAASPR
jgi:hypothetical protein